MIPDRGPSLLARFRPVIIALAAILLTGTLGYMVIEGASPFDALYMTVITITTVGFSEHVPLSTAGRAFTMVLLLVGVGTLFYGFSTIAEYIFVRAAQFQERQHMRAIEQLKGHVIVCGYGRVGQFAARSLRDSGRTVLVVEQEPQKVRRAEADGFLALQGNATEDETLRGLRLDRASGMLVCTGSDADNVFIALSARTLHPGLEVVARASDPANVGKLQQAGASRVVSPYQTGGFHMANALIRPNLVNFLEAVTLSSGVELWMEEVTIPPGSPVSGLSIREADLGERAGVTLVMVQRPAKAKTHPPAPGLRLEVGDILLALGTREQVQRLERTVQGDGVGRDSPA